MGALLAQALVNEASLHEDAGCGNDFVMLNGIAQHIDLSPEQLRQLADRRFGIGADQILLVEGQSNLRSTFAIAFLTAMVARSSNAATVLDASSSLCMTKG
jgi:hypothetical protein